MNILAIDPGTMTGWATQGASGTLNCRGFAKWEKQRRQAAIFDKIAAAIPDLIHEHKPGVLVIEEMVAAGMKGEASRILLGIRAVVMVAAYRHELMIDPVAISTWKAWAKTHGWGAEKKGDEADACWIRDWWLSERAPLVASA